MFFIKTIGGPFDGETRYCYDPAEFGLSWPFPDELPHPDDGKYVKVNESKLPIEAASHPNVGLGAEYEWVANDQERDSEEARHTT